MDTVMPTCLLYLSFFPLAGLIPTEQEKYIANLCTYPTEMDPTGLDARNNGSYWTSNIVT